MDYLDMDNIEDTELQNSKQAEELLISVTQYKDIKQFIENKTEAWNIEADNVLEIKHLLLDLYNEIFAEEDTICMEAVQWIIFEKIHDKVMPCIKTKLCEDDLNFFKKCKILDHLKVSAEQFGADENYTIPLSAAVVELSMLDSHKSPAEKINCLCSTYDLIFAEIKSAIVSMISQVSEKDNEIPIIDNSDVIPVLMIVIIRSKLVYMFSNLFYIKSFCYKMEQKWVIHDIFKAFETAVNKLLMVDVHNIRPIPGKIIQSIDAQEYIKVTSPTEEDVINKTLVDEANQRVLNLITKATDEDEPC